MLLFWKLVGSKVVDWCNMGYNDLWLLFVKNLVWEICEKNWKKCDKFWLFLIVFVLLSCFKLVFLWKAIMGCKLLNISLKLLSMLNTCQCLFIIFFISGSSGLSVNENGIVFLCLGLRCFKSDDLSSWSTLCFLAVDSFWSFSTNLFIRSWECVLYSSKVEHMRLVLSAWLCGILF